MTMSPSTLPSLSRWTRAVARRNIGSERSTPTRRGAFLNIGNSRPLATPATGTLPPRPAAGDAALLAKKADTRAIRRIFEQRRRRWTGRAHAHGDFQPGCREIVEAARADPVHVAKRDGLRGERRARADDHLGPGGVEPHDIMRLAIQRAVVEPEA